MKIFTFEEKIPKRGKIICFSESEAEADFYFLDSNKDAWEKIGDEWEYACSWENLKNYGHYSHWARIDKIFNIDFDIPKIPKEYGN